MARHDLGVDIQSALQEGAHSTRYTGKVVPNQISISGSTASDTGRVLSIIGNVIGDYATKKSAEEEIQGRMSFLAGDALDSLTGNSDAFIFGFNKSKAEAELSGLYGEVEQTMASEYADKSPAEFSKYVASKLSSSVLTNYPEINKVLVSSMDTHMQQLATQHAGMYAKHIQAQKDALDEFSITNNVSLTVEDLKGYKPDVVYNAINAQLSKGEKSLFDKVKSNDDFWGKLPTERRMQLEDAADGADALIYDRNNDAISKGSFMITKQLSSGELTPEDARNKYMQLYAQNGLGADTKVGAKLLSSAMSAYWNRQASKAVSDVEDAQLLAVYSNPKFQKLTGDVATMVDKLTSPNKIVAHINKVSAEIGLPADITSQMVKSVGGSVADRRIAIAHMYEAEARAEARKKRNEDTKLREAFGMIDMGKGLDVPMGTLKKVLGTVTTQMGDPITSPQAGAAVLGYSMQNKDSRMMYAVLKPALYGSPYSGGKINKDMENAIGYWQQWYKADPASATKTMESLNPELAKVIRVNPEVTVRTVMSKLSTHLSNPAMAATENERYSHFTKGSAKKSVKEAVQDSFKVGGIFGMFADKPVNTVDVERAVVRYAAESKFSNDEDAIAYGVSRAADRTLRIGKSLMFVQQDEALVQRMFKDTRGRSMADVQYVLDEWEKTEEYAARTKDAHVDDSAIAYDTNMNMFTMNTMMKDGSIKSMKIRPEVIMHEYQNKKVQKDIHNIYQPASERMP